MKPKTLAVADDHPAILESLKYLPQLEPAFRIEHACLRGSELIDELARRTTDFIVTDFSMPRGKDPLDGFTLLTKLREVAPEARIILFTALSNSSIFLNAIKLGVRAIVSKEDPIDEVVQACIYILSGHHCYFSPAVQAVMQCAGRTSTNTVPNLTPKELEVVRLFVAGHSLASIAERLGRSVSTISTQKYTAMRKLRADSNTDLIRYAYENGLV